MPRLSQTPIASVMAVSALVALAAALADPAVEGAQALAQHRLFAAGSLAAALAAAVAVGAAIGRGASRDVRAPTAITADPPVVAPVTADVQTETMSGTAAEFLANVNHELRTPLNAVIGFAELILSEVHGPVNDQRYREYARHVRTGGNQLLAIIEATLDMSQLAAGRLELQPRRVDPQNMLKECARSVAAQAEAASVELLVLPSTAPPFAADPARLKQALVNVLSNGIKFTAQGGRVSIGAADHGGVVAIEVTDTGVGMTPDQVGVALQPFRTNDDGLTRRHGGIGLGLPLAERLVRLHGGELRIDSRPGCGTVVTVILPAQASRDQADEQ
jgi:signal transduction histidine kinase